MTRKLWLRLGFLAVTLAAIGLELGYACDDDQDSEPWTSLLVDNVPAPLTFAAIAVLVVWLPIHFAAAYRRKRASK